MPVLNTAGAVYLGDREVDAVYAGADLVWEAPAAGDPYLERVLSLGPLSFWRLGEAPGAALAEDATGFYDAAYTLGPTLGVPGLVAGSSDTAMQLAGVQNQGVTAYNSAAYQRDVLTVEAWVQTANAGAAYRSIVVKQNSYGLFANGNVVTVYVWGTGTNVDTGANIGDGSPHHVVGVFNGAASRVYVDGSAVGSVFTYATSNHAGQLDIGYNDYAGQEWNGVIDDVAVYPRALSAAEVAGNHAAGAV